jgi:hypothetical protein
MTSDNLPDSAIKKATHLVRDARQAIMVGLIPVLGLIFILRLVQWYQLKGQYPSLAAADAGEQVGLAREFRAALPRLWFAVLFWPVLILFSVAYLAVA